VVKRSWRVETGSGESGCVLVWYGSRGQSGSGADGSCEVRLGSYGGVGHGKVLMGEFWRGKAVVTSIGQETKGMDLQLRQGKARFGVD